MLWEALFPPRPSALESKDQFEMLLQSFFTGSLWDIEAPRHVVDSLRGLVCTGAGQSGEQLALALAGSMLIQA